MPHDFHQIEQRTQEIGAEMLQQARDCRGGFFGATSWSDRLMEWATQDEAFKTQLFRFVDVFPTLTTAKKVYDHLVEYLSQPGLSAPRGMGLAITAGRFLKGITAEVISRQIRTMARRFIAGEDATSALPALRKLWKHGAAFSVDLLGEACVSAEEAHAYAQRYLDLIETLPNQVAGWPVQPRVEGDHLGPIPRVNVSIKITSLDASPNPIDYERTIGRLTDALGPVLTAAKRHGVFVNFDIEQARYKELSLDLFRRCSEKYEFGGGLAMQAYLRTGDIDAANMIAWAKRTGRQITVRLVKGAYWDYETIHAEQMGWLSPVWPTKPETDACFERMSAAFIDACPRKTGEGGVKLALGSHNVRSIAHALALLESRKLPTSALELQMLHGMGGQLKEVAIQRDLRLREYIPVGPIIPGMAYLVRRLLENTSNNSWLRAGFMENAGIGELLSQPRGAADEPSALPQASTRGARRLDELAQRHRLSPAPTEVGDGRPFINEPMRDFSDTRQRDAFAAAIARTVVASVKNDTSVEQATAQLRAAHDVFPAWRDTDIRRRAAVLVEAAAIMRARRDELSGIIIRESSKPWREADADVCEAIDFCEYYARGAVDLMQPKRLGRYIGELNESWYQPRGVAVVISPWNFPLAICCGMTVAALVTGNTVLVKPAEQTPGIAKVMCDILHQAGAPANVLHFVPGIGETVGAALVRDPRTAIIAFTGSKAVGLNIIAAAGQTPAGQPHVKKVICEMGGKNAIIVDSSADLDEAVLGVRDSAFGYAGQKCSACSRVIVMEDVHDLFVKRLVEATRALCVGDPFDPGTDVPPVIDDAAAAKIREYVEIGKREGKMVFGEGMNPVGDAAHAPAPSPRSGGEGWGEGVSSSSPSQSQPLTSTRNPLTPPSPPADRGRGSRSITPVAAEMSRRLIPPHIFTGITPQHRLANEEIFGPVLAVMKAKAFDEAIAMANGVDYKLTGGIFTRTPSHLDRARREFRVGNLYINRGITGALVARQPFGGFGLSGVGSKAGGWDYLLQFVEPRACSENTLRHGFAPGM